LFQSMIRNNFGKRKSVVPDFSKYYDWLFIIEYKQWWERLKKKFMDIIGIELTRTQTIQQERLLICLWSSEFYANGYWNFFIYYETNEI
jgi:hypothetical protein